MALDVNPLLLSFLLEEGYVLCLHDNPLRHTAAATEHALRGVQVLWPARSPDLSSV